MAEDDTAAITLSGSDPEGDALTFAIATAPAHGTLAAIGTPTCTAPVVCTAAVGYTPDRDFNGTDSFAYRADDGTGTSTPASVSITVDPVNDAPVADRRLEPTTDEDTPTDDRSRRPLVSDVETADANLTYTIVTRPGARHLAGTAPHGPTRRTRTSTAPTASPTRSPTAATRTTARAGRRLRRRRRPRARETVSITVNPVNDAPIATDGRPTTDEDTPRRSTLAALVSDVETADANLTYTIVVGPGHGALTGIGAAADLHARRRTSTAPTASPTR